MVWLWLGGLTGAVGYLAGWVWVLKRDRDELFQLVDALHQRLNAGQRHAGEPRRKVVGIFNDGG